MVGGGGGGGGERRKIIVLSLLSRSVSVTFSTLYTLYGPHCSAHEESNKLK